MSEIKEKEEIPPSNSTIILPGEENTVGNKIEDFEILNKLGEGAFGKVFKVRSKINNNIYGLKIVDKKIIREKTKSEDMIKKSMREIEILKMLSHPHIIKYYTSFEKDEKLFLVTEYLANGDLQEIINARAQLKKPFKEEELCSIFYQCLSALNYIHELGIMHRDIKPGNIFLDSDLKIKIGDFGTAALNPKVFDAKKGTNIKYSNATYMSKVEEKLKLLECQGTIVGTVPYMADEMLRKKNDNSVKYDQKIDVASMGITFYRLAYLEYDLNFKGKRVEDRLIGMIYQMNLTDVESRLSAKQAYMEIREKYFKISKSSSINALISCLIAFYIFNESIIQEEYKDKPFIKEFIKAKKLLFSIDDCELFDFNISKFREFLSMENLKFEGIEEIEPSFLLSFLLEKIHEETLEKKNISQNIEKGRPHLLNSNKESEARYESFARIYFEKDFEQYDSLIISNLKGLIKETNKCDKCQFITYSFSYYFFANVDLSKNQKEKKIDIKQKLEEKIIEFKRMMFCNKCFQKVEHSCTYEYYTFPKFLIISIQRGISEINEVKVNLKDSIELNILDHNKTERKYKLVALIAKTNKTDDKKEKYYSHFLYKKLWFRNERFQKNKPIKSPFEKLKDQQNEKDIDLDIVMLFYASVS